MYMYVHVSLVNYSHALPGWPVKAVNLDEIKHLRKLGFSWVKIAEKSNVSRQTLYWHLEGNSDLIGYTVISDQELDSIISAYLITPMMVNVWS